MAQTPLLLGRDPASPEAAATEGELVAAGAASTPAARQRPAGHHSPLGTARLLRRSPSEGSLLSAGKPSSSMSEGVPPSAEMPPDSGTKSEWDVEFEAAGWNSPAARPGAPSAVKGQPATPTAALGQAAGDQEQLAVAGVQPHGSRMKRCRSEPLSLGGSPASSEAPGSGGPMPPGGELTSPNRIRAACEAAMAATAANAAARAAERVAAAAAAAAAAFDGDMVLPLDFKLPISPWSLARSRCG